MFSKLALFFAAAFAASAVAGPITDSCNTGPVQCCDLLNAPNSSSVADVLGLLGVVVGSLTGQVGLQCTPITGIGVGVGANCASTPVCCDKTFDSQLVGINCTPITINA